MFVLCPGRSKVDLPGKGVQKVMAGSSGGQKAKTSVFPRLNGSPEHIARTTFGKF